MCDSCEYEEYVEIIEEMIDDESLEFANDTLTGILSWVKDHGHITSNQKNAIDNIKEKSKEDPEFEFY